MAIEITNQYFSEQILSWFDQYGRKDLPWQKIINPYRVWVSEIMLQQTQVKTVIPYFNRFIKRFPNLKTLASAQEEEVLILWSGLGYYARARNLYKTASIIHRDFQGVFPMDLDILQKLPGIGRSTAGAIVAIVNNQSVPILDGNVKRVLTRFHGILEWPNEPHILKKLWLIAEQSTPKKRAADYTQAIMDFGAIICGKKPRCDLCILREDCVAFQSDQTKALPVKKIRSTLPIKSTIMLVLQHNDHILLKKRASLGLWSGLWCFPEKKLPEEKIKLAISEEFSCEMISTEQWAPFRHTFTHFHLDIHILLVKVNKTEKVISEDQTTLWHNINNPEIAVPTPIKKIIERLKTRN